LVNAFHYVAPPLEGCAARIDRTVKLMAGTSNTCDVITLLINQNAQDLMVGAPQWATTEQLG
jgi:aspartyl-tRNA synthetase